MAGGSQLRDKARTYEACTARDYYLDVSAPARQIVLCWELLPISM